MWLAFRPLALWTGDIGLVLVSGDLYLGSKALELKSGLCISSPTEQRGRVNMQGSGRWFHKRLEGSGTWRAESRCVESLPLG